MSAVQRAARRRRKVDESKREAVSGRRRVAGILAGLLLAMVVLGLVSVAGVGLYAAARYRDFVSGVQPPEELLASLPRGGARIYDRNGTLLYEFVDQFGGLRRPVPLTEISPWLIDAAVATEDSSFWENSGLNVRGLARAAWENFSPFQGDPFQGSGGSSITQQLAKTVYIAPAERLQRSVERKLKEAAIALELTTRYPKDQVLEWYLNSISYGGVYVGIEAASQGYFGKPASELTLAEASLLAGIPQQPVRYDPLRNPQSAKARQAEVLDLMVRHNRITSDEALRARSEPITLRQARFEIDAPHFVLGPVATEITERFGADALYRQGLEVTTTLDLDLQKIATDSLEKWIREFETQSRGHNGAFYALDPKTGQVLVYVGSRDYFRDDILGRNDNITSMNSPGSTLKPFTYMTAFQKGWSTGAGIFDVPTKIKDASTGEDFSPRNPINTYQGIVPADKALGNSLNVTALKAIIFAGVPQTLNTLRSVGFTTLNNAGGYGPALTLGGVDVTLQDLTYAYSVLAAKGVMRGEESLVKHLPGERQLDPAAILRVASSDGKVLYQFNQPAERRIVSENYAYLVTSIISDGNNQCVTFGACGAIQLADRPSAQKTGTSEPYGDESKDIGETWAVGYTPHLVAGVWFGNSDNSRMVNILSTSVSWRAWRDFMSEASKAKGFAATAFERPPGVIERDLCYPSGKLPSDLCPTERRYKGLYATETLGPTPDRPPPALFDTWWQRVRIDIRNGQLAQPGTPAQFAREEVRLVLPREETEGWNAFEWATKAGLGGKIAPSDQTANTASLVQIIAPADSARLTGVVSVVGRAASPDFQRYFLEYGTGPNPSGWTRIYSSESATGGGELAKWDTSRLPDANMTLRLLVEDAKLGPLYHQVSVTVANRGGPSTTPTPTTSTPTARISSPVPGVTVGGVVQVEGVATAPNFNRAQIDIGRGLTPNSWEPIATLTSQVQSGVLTTWNTRQLPDGIYVIRITVLDTNNGSTTASTVLTVKNAN